MARLEPRAILMVVCVRHVGPIGDEREVRLAVCAAALVHVLRRRLQLVLVHARLGIAHRFHKRIAFRSLRDDAGGEIYVMNDDGSNPTRLTPDLAIDQLLRWSR